MFRKEREAIENASEDISAAVTAALLIAAAALLVAVAVLLVKD